MPRRGVRPRLVETVRVKAPLLHCAKKGSRRLPREAGISSSRQRRCAGAAPVDRCWAPALRTGTGGACVWSREADETSGAMMRCSSRATRVVGGALLSSWRGPGSDWDDQERSEACSGEFGALRTIQDGDNRTTFQRRAGENLEVKAGAGRRFHNLRGCSLSMACKPSATRGGHPAGDAAPRGRGPGRALQRSPGTKQIRTRCRGRCLARCASESLEIWRIGAVSLAGMPDEDDEGAVGAARGLAEGGPAPPSLCPWSPASPRVSLPPAKG